MIAVTGILVLSIRLATQKKRARRPVKLLFVKNLVGCSELGISLQATFRDIDTFVLFLFAYADTQRFLDDEPDDQAGYEYPGEDRYQANQLNTELGIRIGEADGGRPHMPTTP